MPIAAALFFINHLNIIFLMMNIKKLWQLLNDYYSTTLIPQNGSSERLENYQVVGEGFFANEKIFSSHATEYYLPNLKLFLNFVTNHRKQNSIPFFKATTF